MTDDQGLKKWLESLTPEKYHQVIDDVFVGIANKEEMLIGWLNDGKEMCVPAKCAFEQVSERCGVPFSFCNMEVSLYRTMLQSISRFVDSVMEGASNEAKVNFSRPIVQYQSWVISSMMADISKYQQTKGNR